MGLLGWLFADLRERSDDGSRIATEARTSVAPTPAPFGVSSALAGHREAIAELESRVIALERRQAEREAAYADQLHKLDTLYRRLSARFQRAPAEPDDDGVIRPLSARDILKRRA